MPSEWSAVWSFTYTKLAVAVEGIIPELLRPATGSVVETPRPRFEVRVPPEAIGEKCEIGISTPARLGEMLVYSGELPVESGIVTWVPETDLTPKTMYQWQARLVGGEWSQTAAFVVRPDIHFAPNPFSLAEGGQVTIYNLPADAEVHIHTISGKLVTVLEANDRSDLVWDVVNEDGERLGPGVYLYTVRASGLVAEGKFAVAP